MTNSFENGKESSEKLQSVQILSEFDWGSGAVETVRLWPPSTLAAQEKFFEVSSGSDFRRYSFPKRETLRRNEQSFV